VCDRILVCLKKTFSDVIAGFLLWCRLLTVCHTTVCAIYSVSIEEGEKSGVGGRVGVYVFGDNGCITCQKLYFDCLYGYHYNVCFTFEHSIYGTFLVFKCLPFLRTVVTSIVLSMGS
jgi:hypothetical protein